jgi:hypothetical protein
MPDKVKKNGLHRNGATLFRIDSALYQINLLASCHIAG